MFTMVIFRSDNLTQAFGYYRGLFSMSIFSKPVIAEKVNTIVALIAILIMFIAEWLQRDKQHPLQIDGVKKFTLRLLIYYGLVAVILFFSANKTTDFIYFKF